MKNSRGKSRRYSYNARGALTEYVGADGRHLLFQYDARGTLQNVIKAQNANLIYQRDLTENIFGIKKANSGSLLQIQNIGYTTSFANPNNDLSSNSSTDEFCLFGNDGFSFDDPSGTWLVYYIEPSQDPFSICNDPFAGMWDFEVSSFSPEQETCEQCRRRETNNCQSTYQASLENNTAGLVAGTGGCVGIAFATVAVGGLICQVFVSGGVILSNKSAATTRDNCLTNVDSKCESKCSPK